MTEAGVGENRAPGTPGKPGPESVELERRYWRTWLILALLPVLSVCAYLTGVRGLAIFATILVIACSTYVATTSFMHIDTEPRFVPYLCILAFAFSVVLLVLVAPDVMMHRGQQWVNVEAEQHGAHAGHGEGASAHAPTHPGPETGAQYQRIAPAEGEPQGASPSGPVIH